AGPEPAGFRDPPGGPLVVQGPLDHQHVVLHLDHDAVVGPTRHVPDPVGRLLADHPRVGHGGLADAVGHRDVGRHVRPHIAHGQVRGREAADALLDAGRELHPVEVAILRVAHLHRRVAHTGLESTASTLVTSPRSSSVALTRYRPGTAKAIV